MKTSYVTGFFAMHALVPDKSKTHIESNIYLELDHANHHHKTRVGEPYIPLAPVGLELFCHVMNHPSLGPPSTSSLEHPP
jgi:hypothetical protein